MQNYCPAIRMEFWRSGTDGRLIPTTKLEVTLVILFNLPSAFTLEV